MSVSLNPPNTLGFTRPLTQLVKRSLTITNHNSQPIAFKVKTTAPKLYCVRPNSGRVEPGESLEVAVMLQAMREEPHLSMKCKDKFLIQSTIITPDKETMALQDIWASSDANEEGKVYQQKLRVAYLPAVGQALEEEDESMHANQSSMLNASELTYDTVRQPSATNGHPEIPTFSNYEDEQHQRSLTPPAVDRDFTAAPEESVDHHVQQQPYQAPVISEPVYRAPTPPAAIIEQAPPSPKAYQPPVPQQQQPQPPHEPARAPSPVYIPRENPVNAQLLVENKDLRSEIERLAHELAIKRAEIQQAQEQAQAAAQAHASELRQRRRSSGGAHSAAGTEVTLVEEPPVHQDGVPLNVVVIIAFTVFFMTYVFF